MYLEQFGWNAHVARAHESARPPGLEAGRVWTEYGTRWGVITNSGERLCVPRRDVDELSVGDWVTLDGEWIECVLERRSTISRRAAGGARQQVLAANVDVAFIVTGLDQDFNLRRIERYLVLADESRARPVLVLNKADACPDPASRLTAAEAVSGGAPVLALSALHDDSVEILSRFVARGETAVLLGSSGVGKSTLVNRLRGFESQATRAVRESDSRGRHTTTRRELILLAQGWLLLDMPGLREVGLWAEEHSVDAVFHEIADLAAQCRFRDCRHQGEPGCAVAGAVAEDRLASFHKLRREAARAGIEQNRLAQAAEKKKLRALHRSARRLYRDRGR